MAGLAAWITRRTGLREDASLAAIYPISLASGVLILGIAGKRLDLLHLLFGSALAVDGPTLTGMLWVSGFSLIAMAFIYKPLLLDTLDPLFLQTVSRLGPLAHGVFLTLVVLNLVIGFQAIGALMVVGLMMLPAAASPIRLMRRRIRNTPSGAVLQANTNPPSSARRMNTNSWKGCQS